MIPLPLEPPTPQPPSTQAVDYGEPEWGKCHYGNRGRCSRGWREKEEMTGNWARWGVFYCVGGQKGEILTLICSCLQTNVQVLIT